MIWDYCMKQKDIKLCSNIKQYVVNFSDPIDFVIIPHDEYTRQKALDAITYATDILQKANEFMGVK